MTDEDLDNGTFGGSVGLSAACWNRTFATFSAEDILHCRCCVARLKQFRQGRGDDSTTVQCFAGSGWMTHACVLGGLPLMSLLTDSWFMRVFFSRHSFFVLQFTFSIAANLHCGDQSATVWNAKCNYPKCRSHDLRSHSIGCRCVATNGGRGSICDWPSGNGHGWNKNTWNPGMNWWLPIIIGVDYVCPRNYLTAISIQSPTLSGEWNVQAILRGGWGKFVRCLSIWPNFLHSANDFWQVPYHNKPELNRIFPESVAWTRCESQPPQSSAELGQLCQGSWLLGLARLFLYFEYSPSGRHPWHIFGRYICDTLMLNGWWCLPTWKGSVGCQCLGKLDELGSDLFVETGSVSVHGFYSPAGHI